MELTPRPQGSRFAGWSQARAGLVAVLLLALLVAAACVPIRTLDATPGPQLLTHWLAQVLGAGSSDGKAETAKPSRIYRTPGMPFARTGPDLALYDRVVARLERGESYYRFIVAEQRANDYPVRPALVFRLPTLAWITALIGPRVLPVFAWLLLAAIFAAWFRRMAKVPVADPVARRVPAYILLGAATAFNPYYLALHEVWSGLLVALALGLYRADRSRAVSGWLGTWIALALALAIRELALPVVLLLAAQALWRHRWPEAAAWAVLIALFAVAMAVHVHLLSVQTLPNDPAGPGWLMLHGLSGWLSYITMPSPLRFLPHQLAGPLVVLMLLGWIGLRGHFGALIALMLTGYALAFLVAGRWDNFYWGLIVAPVQFAGLALAPRALADLWHSLRGTQTLPLKSA